MDESDVFAGIGAEPRRSPDGHDVGCAPQEAAAPDAAGGDIDLPPERLRAVLGHVLRHSIDPARVRCPQPGESRIIEP